jgi:hypothetical protein
MGWGSHRAPLVVRRAPNLEVDRHHWQPLKSKMPLHFSHLQYCPLVQWQDSRFWICLSGFESLGGSQIFVDP